MARKVIMLDLASTKKAYEGLVTYASRHFSAEGHVILNQEDLVAEGWLVFSKVWAVTRKHCDRKSFDKLFKTSLFNHMNGLLETHRYTQKRGYNKDGNSQYEEFFIDLSDIAEEIGVDQMFDIYFEEYLGQVRTIIANAPGALELFNNLVEPDPRIYELAINESKRKHHLRNQGLLVRGADVVRVRHKHVRSFLGLGADKFDQLMAIIKRAVINVVSGDGSIFAV